jgi:outer membrane protein
LPTPGEVVASTKLSSDPLADALRPTAGGLDPKRVAELGVKSSHSVAAKQAELRSAAAKVDQALVAFFPIVSTSFSYTRLSPVDNTLDFGITIPGMDTGYSFPVILNSYAWDTQIAVPFTDYLLRITQAYSAATEGAESKRLEARAEALKTAADAKVAFLNWIRAKGSRAVADLSVQQTKDHLKDAQATFEARLLSRADLLRLESQLAQAEQFAVATQNFQSVAEAQLRLAVHLEPSIPVTMGIDVLAPPAGLESRPLEELQRIALEKRLELQALDAGKRALEQAEWLAFAGYFPRADGFFSMSYANPNQRIFPQAEQWDLTWMLGVKLSWTVNDTFSTVGRQAEAHANVQALDEQRETLKEGILLSVAVSYYDAQTARSAITAAERSEVAAAEGLRVRRDLLVAGKATSTDIVDAEAEITRARLSRVNAHVDLLVAQARLAYAMGIDVLPSDQP